MSKTLTFHFANGQKLVVNNSDLKNFNKVNFNQDWQIEPVTESGLPTLINNTSCP